MRTPGRTDPVAVVDCFNILDDDDIRRYFELGCEVKVCYSLDSTGKVDPNNINHIAGLEALADADLMVMFTRFRALPDAELKMITDYAESGRPMVGFRTSPVAASTRIPPTKGAVHEKETRTRVNAMKKAPT